MNTTQKNNLKFRSNINLLNRKKKRKRKREG